MGSASALTAGTSVRCVIPTHDRDAFLRRAIDSIAAQTVLPHEVIVVDDLSSPSTRLLVTEAAAWFPVPLHYRTCQAQPRTAGASRNEGARDSVSSFLAFLDDDDWWEPDFLRECLQAVSAPGVEFAVAGIVRESSSGREVVPVIPEGLRAQDVLSVNPGLTGSNFLVRTSKFIELDGFDDSLTVANDQDLLVRLLQSSARYAVVSNVLVHQQAHDDGNQITGKSMRRVDGLMIYLEKHRHSMSRTDVREIKRLTHNTLRAISPSWIGRLGHLAAQIWYSGPRQFNTSIRKLATGKRTVYR